MAKKSVPELEFTSGVATVVAFSAVLFIVSTLCHIPADVGSLDSSAVLKGNGKYLRSNNVSVRSSVLLEVDCHNGSVDFCIF